MNDIHAAIRNIKSKNDAARSLSDYCRILLSESNALALTSMALNYVTLCETYVEQNPETSSDEISSEEAFSDAVLSGIFSELKEKIGELLDGGAVTASDIAELREKNTARMQQITEYIDTFTRDEYLLNRVEHLFEGAQSLPADYDDTDMTNKVMRFLASGGKDSQNLMISEITAQLPVRMTKNRFLDAVRERLSVYRTSDTGAFRDILDMTRSAAGLKKSDPEDALSARITALNSLLMTDRSEMTEAAYRRASSDLQEAGLELNAAADLCEAIQHVLNGFTAALLAEEAEASISGEAGRAFEEIDISKKILAGASAYAESRDGNVIDEVYGSCGALEGHLEELQESYITDGAFVSEIRSRFDVESLEESLRQAVEACEKTAVLLSNSAFAPLDARTETEDVMLSDELFEKEILDLSNSFSEVFSVSGRRYVRAVMGRVFSILPPRFLSQEELETYIFGALSGCTAEAEKLACVELLNELMRD